ncbi:hypothetical protein M885DRAFT_560418 [Pelagophyceae sp. CCMP2097]|nr:hypothetical protein M885DRAFT_560418 [Pelagophyceae sp. CCMP2097]
MPELEAVCDALYRLEQADDRPRGQREIATTLVSERIITHRIYAPHAPYSNGELVAGFQVITEQLTRLGAEVPNATLTERCTCVEPRMLFNILPLATERLRCDAVATREKVVTLFTKLFAATRYDYAGHYLEWVERLRDTEPAIRARMASLALKVIETRPQLRADLLRHVAKCSATPPTTSASRPSTLLRLHPDDLQR